MTIQHDSVVHEGVCSTECQHTQPINGLHTQQDGPHAQTGAGPDLRTTHVRVYYNNYVVIIIVLLPNGMHACSNIFL